MMTRPFTTVEAADAAAAAAAKPQEESAVKDLINWWDSLSPVLSVPCSLPLSAPRENKERRKRNFMLNSDDGAADK